MPSSMFSSNHEWPYDIGGITKSGESYRMILKHSPGRKALWQINYDATPSLLYKSYMVDDSQVFSYSIQSTTHCLCWRNNVWMRLPTAF
jgi:hypothetical protein